MLYNQMLPNKNNNQTKVCVCVSQFNSVLVVGNDEGQKVTGLTAILFTAEN